MIIKKIVKKLGYSAICLLPIAATACTPSDVNQVRARLLNANAWNGNGQNTKYSELNQVNVTLEQAIYGTNNFNNGNYIFIYGTTANNDTRTLLYGARGNNNSSNNTVSEQNFSSSSFFQNFFRANNSLGSGGLLPFRVSLLLFIDRPPYNPNASVGSGLNGNEDPLATYSSTEVVNEFNSQNGIVTNQYTEKTLPVEARAKIGTYKRNDLDAIAYRNLVNYIQIIRPNLKGTAANAGLIAFATNKAPVSYEISSATLYNDLINYYQNF